MSAPGTPKASQAAITAVQEALGCVIVPFGYHHWEMGRKAEWVAANSPTEGLSCTCWLHQGDEWTDRGCETAVAAADAAAPHNAAQAWDEGYAVAEDDFVHSDYCGTKCQCQGIYGQGNPYRVEAGQ